MAETRARRWEKEIRAEYQNGTVTLQKTKEQQKTEQFYEHCTKNITGFFKGKAVQDISPLDIEK